MELKFLGSEVVEISLKKSAFHFYPYGANKLDAVSSKARAVLIPSSLGENPAGTETLVLDGAGEYEVDDTSIHGIPVPDKEGKSTTIYRVTNGDQTSILLLPVLKAENVTDQIKEAIGVIHILVLPVEGEADYGPAEAAKLVRLIGPQVVAPLRPAKGREALDGFVHEVGGVLHEDQASLKTKSLPTLGEELNVYLLK